MLSGTLEQQLQRMSEWRLVVRQEGTFDLRARYTLGMLATHQVQMNVGSQRVRRVVLIAQMKAHCHTARPYRSGVRSEHGRGGEGVRTLCVCMLFDLDCKQQLNVFDRSRLVTTHVWPHQKLAQGRLVILRQLFPVEYYQRLRNPRQQPSRHSSPSWIRVDQVHHTVLNSSLFKVGRKRKRQAMRAQGVQEFVSADGLCMGRF